jgi:uncharacterized protein (DUF1499 family)
MKKIRQIIKSMPRARLVSEATDYLRAEFTTLIFRFVDDVEFLWDENEKVLHFRSASRSGYYDLGVNRRRMEKMRKEFQRGSVK